MGKTDRDRNSNRGGDDSNGSDEWLKQMCK
jgi:hypothetical protein